MDNLELINFAIEAAKNSYSPYSKFKVGAALLCSDGTVFNGCNVENISYGVCNCAERTAVFSAVAKGKKEFKKIAVIGINGDKIDSYTLPCGICRQVLSEFCSGDFEVILFDGQNEKVLKLSQLLPYPFSDF